MQANEARRLVEAASKSIMETRVTSTTSCHQTQTEDAPPPRPPPPSDEAKAIAPRFLEYLEDIVLQEGCKCVMKARVQGDPAPRLTWFKDGVAVKNENDDYRSTCYPDGLCLLTIDETMAADSANWSVRACNQAGYAESHAKLTVLEVEPPVEQFIPSVMKPLCSTASCHEGDSFEFVCKFSGYPQPTVSWFKNGICIDRSRSYTIGECSENNVLKIDRVVLEDAGGIQL